MTPPFSARAQRVLAASELPIILLLCWMAFIAIPISLGKIGLSWDALNHHFYLGWVAEQPRFDRDFMAVSYQAYQFPYLYWPVHKLAAAGLSGAAAGIVLATLSCLAVPPVWMIARRCMPGAGWFDAAMRALAVALAFMSGLVLSMFDSTSNDLFAAIPFVWSLAFAVQALGRDADAVSARRAVMLSGLLAGASVACKLSNGPLALLLPALWSLSAQTARARLAAVIVGGLATAVGFLLAYGYWGWKVWQVFGNPVYPFSDPSFAPVRAFFGWQP